MDDTITYHWKREWAGEGDADTVGPFWVVQDGQTLRPFGNDWISLREAKAYAEVHGGRLIQS